MDKKKFSPIVIIIAFFIFYPIGIYMIISNVIHSSSQQKQNSMSAGYMNPTASDSEQKNPPAKKNPGGVARVFGWILLVIGIITILPILTTTQDISSMGFIFFVFILGGLFLINLGNKLAKKEKRRREYVRIINNSFDLSISAIANQARLSETTVLKDLSDMLADGYFPNCHIDRKTMTFCLPRVKDAQRYDYRTIPVTCKSCGAKTVLLAGTVKRCEYCGSPLSSEEPVTPPTPKPQSQAHRYLDPFA